MRLRRFATSRFWPRQSVRPFGPFAVRTASNLSVGFGICVRAFSGEPPLPRQRPLGLRITSIRQVMGSLCLSAAGFRFLEDPAPGGDLAPPCGGGLPWSGAPTDPNGVVVARVDEIRGVGVLPLPRSRRCRFRHHSQGWRRCRWQRCPCGAATCGARSLPSSLITVRQFEVTRPRRKFICIHPVPSFPGPRSSRAIQNSGTLTPASHPPVARSARGDRKQARTLAWNVLVSWHSLSPYGFTRRTMHGLVTGQRAPRRPKRTGSVGWPLPAA